MLLADIFSRSVVASGLRLGAGGYIMVAGGTMVYFVCFIHRLTFSDRHNYGMHMTFKHRDQVVENIENASLPANV